MVLFSVVKKTGGELFSQLNYLCVILVFVLCGAISMNCHELRPTDHIEEICIQKCPDQVKIQF